MSMFYLAINAYASLEEHVVGTLDFWCPAHQAWEDSHCSIWVHCVVLEILRRGSLLRLAVFSDSSKMHLLD